MSKDPTGNEIAEAAPDVLAEKAKQTWARSFALAVAAGVLIGFGGIAFLVVQAATMPAGPVQLLSGVAFSAGLVMVVVTGAELFTGNTMFALPAATGRAGTDASLPAVAHNLALSTAGNVVGGVAVALVLGLSLTRR